MKVQNHITKIQVQEKNLQSKKDIEIHKTKDAANKAEQSTQETGTFTVNRIRQKIDSEPQVDLKRVNEIKTKIKKGEYKIDIPRLAQNIVHDSILEDLD